MQPEKKQLEILIMQYFRESYVDFPKGLVTPSESPDFLLKLKSKNLLGIELTRLNPGNALTPDDLALVETGFREHIIESAKTLFEQSSSQKLFVKFLFSNEKRITSNRELMLTVKTVNVIRDAIRHKNPSAFFKVSIPQNQLPDGINDILIVNHPYMATSIWERSNNLGVSNNVVDDIRNSIHKKDEKLRLYQKQHLNYYWLLITIDRLRGVKNFDLPNKIMNHKFQSHFQHIFLFDLMQSDIYQLI